MTGICGWLTNKGAPEGADLHIQEMAGPLNTPGSAVKTENSGLAAVASVHSSGLGDAFTDQDICIAWEGTLHWYSEQLQSDAKTHGHTSVIRRIYREKGHSILDMVHGAFCLAIIDTKNRTALLAVDRMGIRPLCYHVNNGQLVFASSTDSLIRHPDIKPELNNQSIYHYLYYHMVPSPQTIYSGIEKLLPGQCLRIKDGHVSKEFYWQLEYHDESTQTEDEFSEKFRQLLLRNIHRYTGYGKTGAFLSGGTDSSTMAGIMSKAMGAGVNTYSIGFNADGFDESEYARITSRHFRTNHHEYRVTPDDVASAIPMIASAYDEPFGNASAVPAWFCAKMAHNDGTRVMIAGDGGDEIFAGNERYAKQQIFEKYSQIPPFLRHNLLEPTFLKIPGISSVPGISKISSYIRQASTPLPDRLEAYNFLHRYMMEDIFYPEFLAVIDRDMPLEINREVYNRTHSSDNVNKMMHLDLKNTLADNDLRKVNRMCELAGITVCYPLLDQEMVEFSAIVPGNIKLKDGQLRYFFKLALKDFLPEATLKKSKHGFGLPFGLWLKEHAGLQEIARDNMSALAKRGYVRASFIDQLMKQHRFEHASYYGVMVWVMMMLNMWLDAHEL